MNSNKSSGSLTVVRIYITAAVFAWWLFDAEGLHILSQLTAPAWDRSVSGVERPAFDPGTITTLATGHADVVRVIVKTK